MDTNLNNEHNEKELLRHAVEVSKNAYAPYSRFPIGASVRTKSGNIFDGCNVENMSFGLTICAERNAIQQMVAAGDRTIEEIVLYSQTDIAVTPCGACLQVIKEFSGENNPKISSHCEGGKALEFKLSDLLPISFRFNQSSN